MPSAKYIVSGLGNGVTRAGAGLKSITSDRFQLGILWADIPIYSVDRPFIHGCSLQFPSNFDEALRTHGDHSWVCADLIANADLQFDCDMDFKQGAGAVGRCRVG